MKHKLIHKAQKGIQIYTPGLYGTFGYATAQMTPEQVNNMAYNIPIVGSMFQGYKTYKNPTDNNKRKLIRSLLSDGTLILGGAYSKLIPRKPIVKALNYLDQGSEFKWILPTILGTAPAATTAEKMLKTNETEEEYQNNNKQTKQKQQEKQEPSKIQKIISDLHIVPWNKRGGYIKFNNK